MELESIHRVWISVCIASLGAIFCAANIWRSTKLRRGFSEHTIKMYLAMLVLVVLGIVGVAGVVSDGVWGSLFGAAAGYSLGNKPWEGAKEQKSDNNESGGGTL